MRALFLSADYPPHSWSGIGAAVAGQAAALVRLGVDVHVVLPASHPSNAAADIAGGPGVHRLSAGRFPLRPWEFDVVHLHSLALSELALEIRRRFGVPVVYTAHSLLRLELEGHPDRARWAAVQVAVMRACDHVVFLSTAERAQAIARSPELARSGSVGPNGLSPPPSPLPPPPPDPAPLVFAGRFTRTKGIDLLGSVVRRLAPHPRLRFVLAGGHGDSVGQAVVSQMAENHSRTCRVLGWLNRDTMDALFTSAALVLVPSRYEPFGMSALEAMRVGAPVLAADVGGLSELVGPGSGGLLVRSHDPSDWCTAILKLWRCPSAREELRHRGPAYVRRHYDAATLAAALLTDVYRPLLARTRGARTGSGAGVA